MVRPPESKRSYAFADLNYSNSLAFHLHGYHFLINNQEATRRVVFGYSRSVAVAARRQDFTDTTQHGD